MRILHVSDLHSHHVWFDWVATHCVEHDLLVIAGDLQNAFSTNSRHEQARAISRWLLSLNAPTCVVTGNHDCWTPSEAEDPGADGGWLRLLGGFGNVIGLPGDVIELHGTRIALKGWLQVPDLVGQVDVLVTHVPPAGCPCAIGAEGRDVGDPALWSAISTTPPRWILSGHVHAPSRLWCRWPMAGPTTTILVPGCEEGALVPAHWVIDTDERTATHSGGTVVNV